MPESPQPSEAQRTILAQAAMREVIAMAKISTAAPEEAPTVTAEQVEDLRRQYPDIYKDLLRSTVRALAQDPQTRRRLYRLLSCAPKEQS